MLTEILSGATRRRKYVVGTILSVFALLAIMHSKGYTGAMLPVKRVEPLWMQQSKEMSPHEQGSIVCLAEYLGIFTFLGKAQPMLLTAIRNQCLFACFKGEYAFAGISGKDLCYCFESLTDVVTSRSMSIAKSIDLAEHGPGGFQTVRIYRKTTGCFMRTNKNRNLKIGCQTMPTEISGAMSSWKMTKMTTAQCILQCEQHSYVIAMPVVDSGVCLCSDAFSMFKTASGMYDAMEACESEDAEQNLYAVYQTTARKSHCEPTRFLKKPYQGKITIITSFPGSGNTWLRHLVERVTGIYTGSKYNDFKLFNGGFLGETMQILSKRTIAVKDHLFKYQIDEQYTSAIVLIRDLYNNTLADFARFKTHLHEKAVDPSIYAGEDFEKFAKQRPNKWYLTQKYIFGNISSVLVVYYENLLDDPVGQLRRIANFLPDELTPKGNDLERRLMCMNLDLKGNFKRPPRNLDFDPFDDELKELFDQSIRNLDDLMRQYDHPSLPSKYFRKR